MKSPGISQASVHSSQKQPHLLTVAIQESARLEPLNIGAMLLFLVIVSVAFILGYASYSLIFGGYGYTTSTGPLIAHADREITLVSTPSTSHTLGSNGSIDPCGDLMDDHEQRR